MSQSLRISLGMQALASTINEALTALAGEEIAFVLVVQADNVAQYASNTKREDGASLLASLLARWQAGRADIPAHYNPDLKKADLQQELLDALERIVKATHSHVDGRDLLAELHPRYMLDIKRRRDGVETWFEGDWLTGLWKEVKNARAVIAKATGSAA